MKINKINHKIKINLNFIKKIMILKIIEKKTINKSINNKTKK